MMAKGKEKEKSRLQKSTEVLENATATQWCYVNTDNEFTFMNQLFVISESVKEYKVFNKAGEVEDFTNESLMENVLTLVDKENRLRFFNQNFDSIDSSLVSVKE